MKELSNDIMTDIAIAKGLYQEREEFLKSVDVKILDSTDGSSRFNAIIDSRRGIVIK
jgi:hypothetical protein